MNKKHLIPLFVQQRRGKFISSVNLENCKYTLQNDGKTFTFTASGEGDGKKQRKSLEKIIRIR